MNILVTGASGFIGSHLSERLVSLGHKVRGIDCLTDYYSRSLKLFNMEQILKQGIECLDLDLAEDDLESAVKDMEVVFHLAGQPGISDTTPFDAYVRNNIVATHRLLEAVRPSAAIKGFINIATSSVYGADASSDESVEPKPTSNYGVTKLAAEQLALSYARDKGFPSCSLRLFSVYGPRERPEKLYPQLISAILEDKPFPLYEGSENHLRSYTFVGDIIDGMVATLGNIDQCVGEIFNIGTDVSVSTAEGIKTVEEIIGKSARIDKNPKRSGDQWKTEANIEKARRVLNYEPTTSVRSGLEKEVEWYKQHILGKIDLWSK